MVAVKNIVVDSLPGIVNLGVINFFFFKYSYDIRQCAGILATINDK